MESNFLDTSDDVSDNETEKELSVSNLNNIIKNEIKKILVLFIMLLEKFPIKKYVMVIFIFH